VERKHEKEMTGSESRGINYSTGAELHEEGYGG